ncbi:MAG: 50S ribosomal protein L13 [Candidatus Caenarcaniphilales bacterium]|nr:50S ribosomal protein L13 [Candidatus Caenarcaniphilales bacterium]
MASPKNESADQPEENKSTEKAEPIKDKTQASSTGKDLAQESNGKLQGNLFLKNKSKFENAETANRKWYLIDAKNQNLGRLSAEIVRILRGKRKPSYTPNVDVGDFVIVINAKEITFKGKNKAKQTVYRRYTGYPGGLRSESLGDLLERIPEKVIYNTVKGMMPRTKLGNAQLTKLKIYEGVEHPHKAQNPVFLQAVPTI